MLLCGPRWYRETAAGPSARGRATERTAAVERYAKLATVFEPGARDRGGAPTRPRARSALAGLAAVVLLAGAVLLCIALACGGRGSPEGGEELFTAGLLPDLLVEEETILLPPALGGNRFLSGWLPSRRNGRLAVRPGGGGGRLELVHLLDRPRTLALDLELGGDGAGGRAVGVRAVGVRAAGRDLGSFPLVDPLKIPLPADLPLGRVAVDLTVAAAADLPGPRVAAARLLPAAGPGDARWGGGELLQSATSLVDYVRWIPAGALLTGDFSPPAEGGSDREFSLRVEGARGEEIAAASFTGGWLSRLAGRRTIVLPLGERAGLRRFRFLATGPPGPPARWRHLRVVGGGGEPPAEPPPTAPPDPPRRVVLYVMDALRADRVGHLGGAAGTSPTLDHLAAEGATFLRHRSVAPNTLPSTKALLTGRAFVHGGGWKLPASGPPTLAELFRRAGYRTGLFSGNVYVGPAYGTDRGFEHVAPGLEVEAGTAGYNDNAARVHRAALDWLAGLAPGDKAFVYLHTIHPHNPYAPPPALAARFTAGIPSAIDGSTGTLLDLVHRRRSATEADQRRLRALYTASFAYNDAELEPFLDRLGRLFPDRETLVVVTSDHGEELFDHGGVLHGYTLYQEMLRIPLVLYAPGRIGSVRVGRSTDTLDLHATLIEICGLDATAGSEGRSLLPWVAARRGEAAAAERAAADSPTTADAVHLAAASSLRGGIFSARSESWKVVWAPRIGGGWGMGEGLGRSRDSEYVFHLATDPGETVNLAGTDDLEAAWLRSRLLGWVQRRLEPDREEEPAPDDAATLRHLRALGYLN